ncbi:MAG: MFS transporter [Bacilli bacterium]|nr:MFS transporter [Bacilli bacterium]
MNYKKEYKKYLTSSVLDTANNRIASASFISAFAIYLGLSDLALGIYAVLDTMTNVIQVFAAPLFSKIGQSKKIVLINYSIYRISSVSMAFIPFLSSNISIRTALFFVLATIYAITGEMGYITFVNWRMTLIKKEDRTTFAAKRNFLKNTVVLAFSLIMGVVLDKFTTSGYELYGFMILFAIVFLIAFIDITIRIKTYKPEVIQEKISIKDNIIIPAKDPKFRSVLITGGLNRFAYGIGTMYLNVFLLRYLNIGYLYYSILNILVNLSEAFSSKFWGNKLKDRNWSKVILPMCAIFMITFIILLLFNNNQLIYLLPIIYIFIGFGNASYEMYDHIAIYESSKEKLQTSYVTFERFIEGIVTMLLPLLSYTIFKESDNAIKLTFVIAIVSYSILFIYYKFKKIKLGD